MASMAAPHLIRLRAPWRIAALAGAAPNPAEQRWESPSAWPSALGANFRGLACCTRVFHAPRALLDCERLWLAIAWPPAAGRLLLNGVELGPLEVQTPLLAHEITAALSPRNELALEVELPPPAEYQPAAPCRVWLEVRLAPAPPRIL